MIFFENLPRGLTSFLGEGSATREGEVAVRRRRKEGKKDKNEGRKIGWTEGRKGREEGRVDGKEER